MIKSGGYLHYVFIIMLLAGTIPVLSLAQSPSDLIPQNQTVGDTAKEMDLLDVYKKWFKLPPSPEMHL